MKHIAENISVYARQNDDGTFKIVVVDHNHVKTKFKDDGWTRMDVDNEGIMLIGWGQDEGKRIMYLTGCEFMFNPALTRSSIFENRVRENYKNRIIKV
jgi:hypothetical protein